MSLSTVARRGLFATLLASTTLATSGLALWAQRVGAAQIGGPQDHREQQQRQRDLAGHGQSLRAQVPRAVNVVPIYTFAYSAFAVKALLWLCGVAVT